MGQIYHTALSLGTLCTVRGHLHRVYWDESVQDHYVICRNEDTGQFQHHYLHGDDGFLLSRKPISDYKISFEMQDQIERKYKNQPDYRAKYYESRINCAHNTFYKNEWEYAEFVAEFKKN